MNVIQYIALSHDMFYRTLPILCYTVPYNPKCSSLKNKCHIWDLKMNRLVDQLRFSAVFMFSRKGNLGTFWYFKQAVNNSHSRLLTGKTPMTRLWLPVGWETLCVAPWLLKELGRTMDIHSSLLTNDMRCFTRSDLSVTPRQSAVAGHGHCGDATFRPPSFKQQHVPFPHLSGEGC